MTVPVEWLLGTLTPGVLLGVCVLFLLTGRLKTRRDHEDRIADKDKVIETQRATIEKLEAQRDVIIEGQELIVDLLRGIQATAERKRP